MSTNQYAAAAKALNAKGPIAPAHLAHGEYDRGREDGRADAAKLELRKVAPEATEQYRLGYRVGVMEELEWDKPARRTS